jgi:large subunit ribosomal protein L10
MQRPEKIKAVAEIKGAIGDAQAVFITEYRGLNVKQMSDLRRQLRKTGADYRVVKMTLARRAADELGVEGLSDLLTGPTGITFAHRDPVLTAKALRDFARENDRLVLTGGLLGRSLLGGEGIGRLAEVEPREVLLAKMAGAVKAPITKAAVLFGALAREAASVFNQLLERKQAQEA